MTISHEEDLTRLKEIGRVVANTLGVYNWQYQRYGQITGMGRPVRSEYNSNFVCVETSLAIVNGVNIRDGAIEKNGEWPLK